MIRLTPYLSGETNIVLVDPANISGVARETDGHTRVYTVGDDQPYNVKETPFDVARLKAAWALRHSDPGCAGELPIAIAMSEDGAGLSWICCEHTHRIRQEAKARAKARRLDIKRLLRRFT